MLDNKKDLIPIHFGPIPLFMNFLLIYMVLDFFTSTHCETLLHTCIPTQSTSDADGNNADAGSFTLSPVFVVGMTILLVHLTTMLIKFCGLQQTRSGNGSGLGEFISSMYV